MLQIKVMYQKEGNSAEVVRNVAEEELQFVLGKMIYGVEHACGGYVTAEVYAETMEHIPEKFKKNGDTVYQNDESGLKIRIRLLSDVVPKKAGGKRGKKA